MNIRPKPPFGTLPGREDWPLEVRTDLAVEARDLFGRRDGGEIPGVVTEVEEFEGGKITRVEIQTEEAERIMRKVRGHYVTIETDGLRSHNRQTQKEISKFLAREVSSLAREKLGVMLGKDVLVLAAGLGNWNSTPDSVGPHVVGRLLVTRHLFSMAPPEHWGGLGRVSAISPGVLGLTGIETAEIILGVVEKVKPDLVVVVDALASRSVGRVGTTIQMGDSGIQPGSGVGNKRFGITRDSLGIPVIAIGVPTVVDAATIVSDAMEIMAKNPRMVGLAGGTAGVPEDARRNLLAQVLTPYMGGLVVTPKEVDDMVRDVSTVIAGGLNLAFHPGMDEEQVFDYLY